MKKLLSILGLSVLFFACQNNSAPAPQSTPNAPAAGNTAVVEAEYKVIIPINDYQPPKGASEDDIAESASDLGFYLIEAEDALKAKGYQVTDYCAVRDSVKIVDKSNKLVKYVSVKAQMGEQCCGVVVAKTGKEPLFIPLNAETPKMVEAAETYFK